MIRQARTVSVATLFLLYPYWVYRSLQTGDVGPAPLLVMLCCGYQALAENRPAAKAKKWTMTLLLAGGALFFQSLLAKLLPALAQLSLMMFFGKTLIQGPPLIERFIRLDFPELSPDLIGYARRLTLVWSGFFAVNALVCAILAFAAPASWWAVYTGVIMFASTALLMAGEYVYRHYRFPGLEIPGVKTTIHRMVLNSRQIWRDLYVD